MINAKTELLSELRRVETPVLCANILRVFSVGSAQIRLSVGFTESEWQAFLEELDFDYEDLRGGLELAGVVWFTDGSWLERKTDWRIQYWEYISCPAIPDDLKEKQND